MRKKWIVSALLSSTLLSGCIAVDIAWLAVGAIEEALTIKYYPDTNVAITVEKSLTAVTPINYKRIAFREEGKCLFNGVIVPWERTWEIPSPHSDASHAADVLPPEPGKIAGYAAVIYQKQCPETAPESMLDVGVQGTGIFPKPMVVTGNTVVAQNILLTPQDQRPQWLGQVIERLIALAPTQPAAQQALAAAKDKILWAMPTTQISDVSIPKP
jgi:hypothetical protein